MLPIQTSLTIDCYRGTKKMLWVIIGKEYFNTNPSFGSCRSSHLFSFLFYMLNLAKHFSHSNYIQLTLFPTAYLFCVSHKRGVESTPLMEIHFRVSEPNSVNYTYTESLSLEGHVSSILWICWLFKVWPQT